MIVIVTLANKPKYLPDAMASVEAQTRRDFKHIVQMDEGIGWDGRYPPAAFWNEQVEAVGMDDYVCWLSDDDLLLPNYVEDLAGHLDAHQEVDCCYGGSRVENWDEAGKIADAQFLPMEGYVVFSGAWEPSCRIDGGQFMMRRSALEAIPRPWVPEGITIDPNAHPITMQERYSDAIFMNKVAWIFGIYPIGKQVMINRSTELSGHARIVDGVSTVADWRTAPTKDFGKTI